MKVYLSEKQIQQRVKQMAAQISQDFKGEHLDVVAVLNGSFIFCADLVRYLDLSVSISFVKASSYGQETKSSGILDMELNLKESIEKKNVLLIEDIVDTGLTSFYLLEFYRRKKPKQLKLASLLFKPALAKYQVSIDYMGFEIENVFVVGYGMDYAGKFRQLPYIGIYDES